jgi:hypothetical protein
MTPRVAGEAIIARVTQPIGAQPTGGANAGQFQVMLYSNGLISPQGTYYTITTRDSNGDIVQVEAYYLTPGQWDLSDLEPYDPNQPPPPLPILIVDLLEVVPYSPTPAFDASKNLTFRITLTGDVTSSTITGQVPGNLYTFIIEQDATGGHHFVWPTNVYNAGPVDLDPNSITIQTFVVDEDNNLYSIAGATYFL